jgi:hypothetical protein
MINPPPPPRPPTPHKSELAAMFITDNPAYEAEGTELPLKVFQAFFVHIIY